MIWPRRGSGSPFVWHTRLWGAGRPGGSQRDDAGCIEQRLIWSDDPDLVHLPLIIVDIRPIGRIQTHIDIMPSAEKRELRQFALHDSLLAQSAKSRLQRWDD